MHDRGLAGDPFHQRAHRVTLGTPPLIDRALITTASNGAGGITVTGAANAILGLGPITLEVRNDGQPWQPAGTTASGLGLRIMRRTPGIK